MFTLKNNRLIALVAFLSLAVQPLAAQDRQQPLQSVSGTVTDTRGQSVPGVTVVETGTGNGVVSDLDGHYEIMVGSSAVLEFSCMGMTTKRENVFGRKVIDVVLTDDSDMLDEIVVVGYGTQRRKLLTSAVSSLKIDESNNKISAVSPAQLLAGRIAGVNINLSSGNLGSRERVSIRGVASLNAGNEPLYVVDGIPISNSNGNLYDFGDAMSSLATINLSDIESVEVLKDAASAAIYGSKASNGVIIITTRSGREGKAQIKANVSYGIAQFPNKDKVKYCDTDLYLLQYNVGADNYNAQYGLKVGDSDFVRHIENPHPGIDNVDWLDLVMQTGRTLNADASVAGGSKNTKYYIGVSYQDQEGIVKTNALQKFSMNAKIDQTVAKWLSVGANMTGSYLKNNQVPGTGSGFTILARTVQKRPFDLPYKPNGDYYVGGTDDCTYHNPIQILETEKAQTDNYRYLGNVYATLNLAKGLSFKTSFLSDVLYTHDYIYYMAGSPYGLESGRIIEKDRFITNYSLDNILNYSNKFNDFTLDAMLGHSFQHFHANTMMIDGNGFPSAAFDIIGVAATIANTDAAISENALESYFTRATVSYKEKYMLTATLRADGSSKFTRKNRWGMFPSLSLGWNISKEDFWNDQDYDLKIRLSYGKTGNQEGIGNYDALPLISGGKNYDHKVGIAVSSFGNQDLTWEKADQYNFGFDFSYLQGKINAIFDVYQKDTYGLLYSKPMHATTGITSLMSNIGSIRNRGIEFTLSGHFDFGDFHWDPQINLGHNKNVVTSLLGDDDLIAVGNNCALQVGREVGSFYIFQMDGIYQYDGEVPLPQYNEGVRAGDVKWHDVDGNNIINDNDRVLMDSAMPDLTGGLNNTFSYKGFQLDVFTNFSIGNKVYAAWKQSSLARVGYYAGCLEEYSANMWTGPNSTNKYARAINGSARSGYNTKNSDRFLEDGSFFRFRTVTLSYNFPRKITDRLKITGLRVFCQADNLLLFTNYSGYDPEVSSSLSALSYGIDNFSMPTPRTISCGINVKF